MSASRAGDHGFGYVGRPDRGQIWCPVILTGYQVMARSIIPLILMLFLFPACATVTVDYDFDREADFSRLTAFKFLSEVLPADPKGKPRTIWRKRITNTIRSVLEEKGFFSALSSQQPDFLVAYQAQVTEKTEVTPSYLWSFGSSPYDMGYDAAYYGEYAITPGYFTTMWPDVSHYREGSLTIIIIDPRTRQIVWRGTGSAVINDLEKTRQNLPADIRRILQNFPPDPGEPRIP